jgi:hypothetical protein
MFNQSTLQFFPALFAMIGGLIENIYLQQLLAIVLVQHIEIYQLLAQEKLQEFPINLKIVN